LDFTNRDVAEKHLLFPQLVFWDTVLGM